MKINEQIFVLKELEGLLAVAEKTYHSYMLNNKKFYFARKLFETNEKIHDLLKSNLTKLSNKNKRNALDLIFHLDTWSSVWEKEYNKQKPKPDDQFTFVNEVNFPKKSVDNLLSQKNKH